MRLIVSDIPEEGLEKELELPIMLDDSIKPDIANVSLKIFKFSKKVLIEGTIHISVTLLCSRCLSDFTYPVNVAFNEEYNPVEETAEDDENELSGKVLDLSFYYNDEIDLQELIKEQVILSVPMKPICIEKCRGICSTCGKDLNKETCQCKTEEVDPRLAPLLKLKETMKNRKTS